MKEKLLVDAIGLLERDTEKYSGVKKYLPAAFILLITFAIPVTITQIYQNNNASSLAGSIQSSRTIQTYITQTVAPTIDNGDNIYAPVVQNQIQVPTNVPSLPATQTYGSDLLAVIVSYWWGSIPIAIILIAWIYLIIKYLKDREKFAAIDSLKSLKMDSQLQ